MLFTSVSILLNSPRHCTAMTFSFWTTTTIWVWISGFPIITSVSLDNVTYFLGMKNFWLVENNKGVIIFINCIELQWWLNETMYLKYLEWFLVFSKCLVIIYFNHKKNIITLLYNLKIFLNYSKMEVNWQRVQQKRHFKIGELISDVNDEAQIRTF